MYAPPPRLTARVFARLPDRFRVRDGQSAWAALQRPGIATDCFLEGPSFDRDGNLWVVDIPYGRIFRISPAGEFELAAQYDGEPNGLKIHRDGRIFIADFKHGILRLDPATGRVEPVVERAGLDRFKGCNDLHFAGNGDLYFTDQGMTGLQDPSGRLYRLSAAGRLECLVDGIPSPNGLTLDPAERVLYLAVTRGNCVWRVPLLPDGSATKVGIFVQLSGGVGGPDGLAIDQAGNLAIAHLGLGAVWLMSRRGEPLLRIEAPAGELITNLAYGGPGDRHLYMTESETGQILVAELETPGQPTFALR